MQIFLNKYIVSLVHIVKTFLTKSLLHFFLKGTYLTFLNQPFLPYQNIKSRAFLVLNQNTKIYLMLVELLNDERVKV